MKMVFQPSIFRYELLVSGGKKSCNLQSLCYCFIQDSYPSRELTYATPKRHPMTLKPLNLQTQIPPRLMLQTMATTLSLIKCHLYTNFGVSGCHLDFICFSPGKSCANIIFGPSGHKNTDGHRVLHTHHVNNLSIEVMSLTKEDRFFLLKKNQPEIKKTCVRNGGMHRRNSFIYHTWRIKNGIPAKGEGKNTHTFKTSENSLTDWKSLLVFTFKWLSLNSSKGCSFSTRIGNFANPLTSSQITPPAVPVEVHGNPQHRRGARTSMLILRYSSNVWSTKRHIYRQRRG